MQPVSIPAGESMPSIFTQASDATVAEKRKMDMEGNAVDAKRARLETPKLAGLWVQQSSISIGAKPKTSLRKSASVNDLWVKQTIAFVTNDM
ncbi:Aste57867_9021 [Aphanomyces stellatus]|uniref:Aste57867_9021 protein n=1 Tax=Aphanomyces stellatus TaxID=120398 RepID=A0A485KM58_9STRA|nr:hypothetical protein As57867_008985 [Aphanomyces stellatus]VFT85905.1 Aste57867_9021 [Aphanomyces stellatus]